MKKISLPKYRPTEKRLRYLRAIIHNRKIYPSFYDLYLKQKKRKTLFNKINKNFCFPYNRKYKNRFRNNLKTKQKLCFFYGDLSLKYLKKTLKKVRINLKNRKIIDNLKNINSFFLNKLEQRLDSILYRSYFVLNFREARYLIKNIGVNLRGKIIKDSSYLVKKGTIISFPKLSHRIIKNNVLNSLKFEFIPKVLQINYKTLQIFYLFSGCMNNFEINKKNNANYPFQYYTNLLFRYFKT